MGLIFAKLLGLFPLTWPEPLRKVAAWASILMIIIAAAVSAKAIYDRSVIDKHEDQRAIESIEARDEAADERADDAIRNAESERKLNDAIDNAPTGGTIDPAMLAANCERLRQQPGGLSERARRICGD
jgi:hypothetical protein